MFVTRPGCEKGLADAALALLFLPLWLLLFVGLWTLLSSVAVANRLVVFLSEHIEDFE